MLTWTFQTCFTSFIPLLIINIWNNEYHLSCTDGKLLIQSMHRQGAFNVFPKQDKLTQKIFFPFCLMRGEVKQTLNKNKTTRNKQNLPFKTLRQDVTCFLLRTRLYHLVESIPKVGLQRTLLGQTCDCKEVGAPPSNSRWPQRHLS